MATGNGNGLPDYAAEKLIAEAVELPPPREAIVEQGIRIQQETAAERDLLRREVQQLKADIAGYKVAIEAQQAQLAEADSRVATMTLVRDEAVGRRAEVEAVLRSMLAIGRAFSIENEPLIKRTDDYEEDPAPDRLLPAEPFNRADRRVGR